MFMWLMAQEKLFRYKSKMVKEIGQRDMGPQVISG